MILVVDDQRAAACSAGPIRFDPSHQSPLDFYITQVQSMRHVVLDKVPNQRDPEEADCRRTW